MSLCVLCGFAVVSLDECVFEGSLQLWILELKTVFLQFRGFDAKAGQKRFLEDYRKTQEAKPVQGQAREATAKR